MAHLAGLPPQLDGRLHFYLSTPGRCAQGGGERPGPLPPPACYRPAWASMFSIKMPYPLVGSLTITWVTATMSYPFWRIGLPLIPCTMPPVCSISSRSVT